MGVGYWGAGGGEGSARMLRFSKNLLTKFVITGKPTWRFLMFPTAFDVQTRRAPPRPRAIGVERRASDVLRGSCHVGQLALPNVSVCASLFNVELFTGAATERCALLL